jgi:ADP-dependent NAD(P)H-hydrate dehydratase / NAD(P)H-hydrate epimerase
MLALVGTVPDEKFPLLEGQPALDSDCIRFGEIRASVNRGTPALVAAALRACEALQLPAPFVYLVGDIGLGRGSRKLYEHLTRELKGLDCRCLTFHYLQPDVDWHNRVLFAMEEMRSAPVLVADAGFMYAAKMSGQAGSYDLFTPDRGELAFLADEEAPHPFYTRGFILHVEEEGVPGLIARAYQHDNGAKCLLVKGPVDYVADRGGVYATIDSYPEEAMEAIGGTGDTLTGIVSALIAGGMETRAASATAALVNRLAGRLAGPTPATQVMEIIEKIPEAIEKVLGEEKMEHV